MDTGTHTDANLTANALTQTAEGGTGPSRAQDSQHTKQLTHPSQSLLTHAGGQKAARA